MDATPFIPAIAVVIGGILAYFIGRVLQPDKRYLVGTFAAAWLAAVFAGIVISGGTASLTAGGSPVGVIAALLATGVGAVAAIAFQKRLSSTGPVHLYYMLYLLALAGAVAIGFSSDLFTIFVMVELSAIPGYALVAYQYKEDPLALRAAMKYLFQGVVGTLSALLGVSLLYLAGHTLVIGALPAALSGADPLVIGLAAILILVGYGVKLGIVPLHTWLPETYTRAPAGVTAILAGATKAGVLVALFLSLSALPADLVVPASLGAGICVLAVITMTAGNLMALNQKDLSMVLAYSSIAQMGYIMLGFGIGMQYGLLAGIQAGLFYLVAYSVMKAGAFLAADGFSSAAGSPEIRKMAGTGAAYPVLGVTFSIFILGLIGVPATAGFLGKFLVFQAGMMAATATSVGLVLILALNSAVSLGYYVPILSTLMFGHPEPDLKHPRLPAGLYLGIIILAAATILLGLFPGALYSLTTAAAGQIFPWGVP